jgi:CTP synthase (UTP-ammonia lyase)
MSYEQQLSDVKDQLIKAQSEKIVILESLVAKYKELNDAQTSHIEEMHAMLKSAGIDKSFEPKLTFIQKLYKLCKF